MRTLSGILQDYLGTTGGGRVPNDLIALTKIESGDSPWAIDTLRKKVQRREVPHVRIGNRIYLERAVLADCARRAGTGGSAPGRERAGRFQVKRPLPALGASEALTAATALAELLAALRGLAGAGGSATAGS